MPKKAKPAPGAARKTEAEAKAKVEAEAETKAEAEAKPEAAGEAEAEAERAEAEAEAPPEAREEVPAEAEKALAAAETEIAELKDRLLRAMAETENVRRRGEREREEAGRYAVMGFAREIVAVADNLRRAIASVPAEAHKDDEAFSALLDGVELTERELLKAFERHGVRRIDPMGEKFDHNWHHAVTELEDPSCDPGTIVQVIEVGYSIADRLLRPAMVALAKGANKEKERAEQVERAEQAEQAEQAGQAGHKVDTKV